MCKCVKCKSVKWPTPFDDHENNYSNGFFVPIIYGKFCCWFKHTHTHKHKDDSFSRSAGVFEFKNNASFSHWHWLKTKTYQSTSTSLHRLGFSKKGSNFGNDGCLHRLTHINNDKDSSQQTNKKTTIFFTFITYIAKVNENNLHI